MGKIYGYCRVSTAKQVIDRQIANIKAAYSDAAIIEEAYTGTKIDRPKWNRLYSAVKAGDTIVFDEISRMSRNAEEGFTTYKDLYDKGVNLVFLKESALNTDNFRSTQQIASVGNVIADMYIETTNKVLMILAEQQIKAAFETAQHEVDFLHKRTKEGLAIAKFNGKQVGRAKGATFETSKSREMKEKIKKLSKAFEGNLSDKETMETLGIARNTYFKYKRELKGE